MSAGLVLAACGGDDAVTVESQWARESAPTQTTGAVYFDLTVAEDDTLVGASVASDVAGEAQIHEVVMADGHSGDTSDEMSGDMDDEMSDEMSGDMDESAMSEGSDDMGDMEGMDGAMRMQEMTDGLALTGGETVTFEPGGYHVMLLDIAEPLEIGDQFEVTLVFAEADDVTIEVEVAETAP